MNLYSFAWRNLLRNRRRSFLAVLSTFLATLGIVAGNGFTEGFLDSMVRNYTKNETGHVSITTEAYRDRSRFMPVDTYLENADKACADIEGLGKTGSILAAPRIRFGVLLSSGPFTKPAIAIAGDPEKEKSLLMLQKSLLPGGAYVDMPGTTIVGSVLASDLGLKVGDSLKIIATKSDGGIGFKSLKISGIFKTGTNALDGSVFQMRLDDAQTMLAMPGGAQQILVMLPDYRKAASWQGKIASTLRAHGYTDLSVLPWTEIGDYSKVILLAGAVYSGIWFFIALLGAFIIANIMTMVVLERRRETGILMAMGMQPSKIMGMFLLEGTMLGLGGSLFGTFAGEVFNLVLSKRGLDLSSSLAGFSWPLDNIIRPTISLSGVLIGVSFCTIAAMLMSILPAWRASRMEVVDSLKAVQ